MIVISSVISNPRLPTESSSTVEQASFLPQQPFIMSLFNASIDNMEFQEAQKFVVRSVNEITSTFQKVPGSAMLIRYIRSSYQDDPVRSAIELVLVIFFIRYLLSPSYSTKNGNFVKLTEEVSTSWLSGRQKGQIADGSNS